VSKRGFHLETHSALGFGSETICPSRGISDSVVKLSALAVELEKPFRVLICRYWHCDPRRFIEEEFSISVWKNRGRFLWHVWSVGRPFELGAFSSSLAVCFYWGRLLHIFST
jgi:hypothetical protein